MQFDVFCKHFSSRRYSGTLSPPRGVGGEERAGEGPDSESRHFAIQPLTPAPLPAAVRGEKKQRLCRLMRYSLRTLLIVMLLGGPALAAMWWWPALVVVSGSAFMTLCVAVLTLWLHGWQHIRIHNRLALGKNSALAAGMELSVGDYATAAQAE